MLKLTSTQEDYLKRIYELEMSGTVCRIGMLVCYFKVKIPSAIAMVERLSELKLLVRHQVRDGCITMTPLGVQHVKDVLERYEFARTMLSLLGLSGSILDKYSCILEHIIEADIVQAIVSSIHQETEKE